MKKAQIMAAALSMLLLTGCGATNTLADNHTVGAAAAIAPMAAVIENPVEETDEIETVDEKAQPSDDIQSKDQAETPAEKNKADADQSTAEKSEAKSDAEKPVVEKKTEAKAETKTETKTEVKAETKSETAKPEKAAETKVTEKKANPAPTTEKKTEPAAPAFEIDYWVSYAKNYAKSIGLTLDAGTSGTWDTPIHANSKTTDVLADYIRDDLNYYKDEEDCTAVWVWAEQVGNGQYELFISRG